ncbi:MAG TPA: ABC transporter ATP-binding protein [Jatrophihabitans sp.]|jgi:ABC-2 type transport system ATP-binding protein
MMNIAAIEIAGLVVVRGSTVVIDGLDASVPIGSITGLIGPSGCGKTTLIRAIVGIQILRSGSVSVLGKPAGSASLREHVSYMTQGSSVYPDLTVQQNLRYFADLSGSASSTIDAALDDVALTDKRHDLVGNLSGGQRTRVSLAAALLARPDLFLLDEPTVGLDPVLRRDLWKLFSELAEAGKTLLVTSHVMDEAARCERVLLMREGRLVADETPAGLRERTGKDDLEEAFLTLAERSGSSDRNQSSTERSAS